MPHATLFRYVSETLSAIASTDVAGVVVFTMVAPGAGGYCGDANGQGPESWAIELFAKGCAVRDAFKLAGGGTCV